MEEYITLRCIDCENTTCTMCPTRTYVGIDSLRGCTRKVSEEISEQYYHYINEVIPFLHLQKNISNDIYIEIYSLLDKIYTCPLGQKIGNNGKIIPKI